MRFSGSHGFVAGRVQQRAQDDWRGTAVAPRSKALFTRGSGGRPRRNGGTGDVSGQTPRPNEGKSLYLAKSGARTERRFVGCTCVGHGPPCGTPSYSHCSISACPRPLRTNARGYPQAPGPSMPPRKLQYPAQPGWSPRHWTSSKGGYSFGSPARRPWHLGTRAITGNGKARPIGRVPRTGRKGRQPATAPGGPDDQAFPPGDAWTQ